MPSHIFDTVTDLAARVAELENIAANAGYVPADVHARISKVESVVSQIFGVLAEIAGHVGIPHVVTKGQ